MRIVLPSLATAILFARAVPVMAADLAPPAAAPWSVSLFGGASWLEPANTQIDGAGNNADDARLSWETGYIVGGTFGYTFNDFVRTELELSYTLNTLDSVSTSQPGGGPDHDVSVSLTALGNVWFGLNMLPVVGEPIDQLGATLGGFAPYVGGGIGVVSVGMGDYDETFGMTSAFAWQVGAGARWNLTSNVGIDVGYRFRGISDVGVEQFDSVDLYSNNVIVGLTFSF